MKPLFAISLVAALVCASCSTTSRETQNPNGTKTKSKQSSMFIQVQGFDDSIDANGAQHTSIANFSTDAQGIMAMDSLLNNFMKNMAVIIAMNSPSNHLGTNFLANMIQQQQGQPAQVTASRHYYRSPK